MTAAWNTSQGTPTWRAETQGTGNWFNSARLITVPDESYPAIATLEPIPFAKQPETQPVAT